MPFIYQSDLSDFSNNKHIPDEETTRSTYYFNENAEYKGDGILSGVGSLLKSGADFVKGNKDLIIQGAKAAGTTAAAINKVVDAVKEDKELKDLEVIRKLQADAASKIGTATSKKIVGLGNPEQKGDGPGRKDRYRKRYSNPRSTPDLPI